MTKLLINAGWGMDTKLQIEDSSLEGFINTFKKVFSKPQLNHFRGYIMGLILYTGIHWVSKMHEHVRHDKEYTSFVRFVSESNWDTEEVEIVWQQYLNHHERRALASMQRKAKGKPIPVYLLIDDTLNPKRGREMEWVGKFRTGKHNPTKTGHCMVSALLVIGNLEIPIGYALYKKMIDCDEIGVRFESKLELAIKLIDGYVPLENTKTYILGDSWYGANDIFKYVVKEKGYNAITAIKSNRKLYYGKTKVQIQVYNETLSEEAFDSVTIERNHYKLHSRDVKLSNGIKGRAVVSRCHRTQKVISFYLFSTDCTLNAKQIVGMYRIRWKIETFYKNVKQLLGLSEYQFIREKAIQRHWLFVFIAYSFLEVQRFELYELLREQNTKAKRPTIGDMKRLYQNQFQRLFVSEIIDLSQQGCSFDEILSHFSL